MTVVAVSYSNHHGFVWSGYCAALRVPVAAAAACPVSACHLLVAMVMGMGVLVL